MPKITATCFLFSLLFFGLGSLKMSALNVGQLNAYVYTEYVFQTTLFFVLTNFLIVVGTGIYFVKTKSVDIKVRANAYERSNYRKRTSVPKVKTRFSRSTYGIELHRRMSS